MKTWYNYYKDKSISGFNLLLHWQYLLKIFLKRPRRILEIGCGPAHHSLFIKKLLPSSDLYLLDSDYKLIEQVKTNHKNLIKKAYVADILDKNKLAAIDLPKVDLVISQGLMEHFNDESFIEIIENFRDVSKEMLFSIPSSSYPTKDYGNEILRNREELVKLLNKVDKINFNISDYIDVGFRTKLVYLKLSDISFIKKLSYLLFGSNHFLIKILYE